MTTSNRELREKLLELFANCRVTSEAIDLYEKELQEMNHKELMTESKSVGL
jgi:hypothetical protein